MIHLYLLICYALLVWLGETVRLPGNSGHLFQPVVGVLVAILVKARYRHWLPVVITAFLTEELIKNLLGVADGGSWSRPELKFSHEAQAALAALFIRRWPDQPKHWCSFEGLARLTLGCALVGAPLGATLTTIDLIGLQSTPDFFFTWRICWSSDTLGALTVATAFLWADEFLEGKLQDPRPALSVESVTVHILFFLILWGLTGQRIGPAQPFLLYPLLLWIGARFHALLTPISGGVAVYFATLSTVLGEGPFFRLGPGEMAGTAVQIFLLALLLSALATTTVFLDRARSKEEKDRILQELQESELRYQNLFQKAPVGILVTENGQVVRGNPAALDLFARTEEQLVGSFSELITLDVTHHPRQPVDWPEQLSHDDVLQVRNETDEGGGARLELYISELPSQGSAKILAVARDKTEQARLEQKLEAQRAELAASVGLATAELESKHRALAEAHLARDRFISTVSHELRTPLSAILGHCETLREGLWGEITTKQEHALERLSESGNYLQLLINDLLDIARVQRAEIQVVPEPISVDTLCRSCLRLVTSMAQRQNVDLREGEFSTDIVSLDRKLCKQVLVNLLTNAIKFTPQGGTVKFQATHESEEIRFTVCDTGPGIAEEFQDKLFQPFARFDESVPGSGLGLSLANRLTMLMEGRLEFETELGAGTTFHFILPDEPVEESETPSESATPVVFFRCEGDVHQRLIPFLKRKGFSSKVIHTLEELDEAVTAPLPCVLVTELKAVDGDSLENLRAVQMRRENADSPPLAVLGPAFKIEEKASLHEHGASMVVENNLPLQDIYKLLRTLGDKRHT